MLRTRTPRPTWATVAKAFQDGQEVGRRASAVIGAGQRGELQFDPRAGIIRTRKGDTES